MLRAGRGTPRRYGGNLKWIWGFMQRQSIRLRGFDYTSSGAYFITICSYQKEQVFGSIGQNTMQCNDWGEIILEEWQSTSKLRDYVQLDEFVVMPNHIHGIIWIQNPTQAVAARRASPEDDEFQKPSFAQKELAISNAQKELAISKGRLHSTIKSGATSGSLGAIVGAFKSAVTKRINQSRGFSGITVWQRDFWERIIRNDVELERIRTYIINNPSQWLQDEDFK
jgi:putative transposase